MKIGVDIRVLMDKYYSGVSSYTANLLNAIFALDKDDEYKLFYNSWQNQDERLGVWNRDNAKVISLHIPNKIFNYFYQKILHRPRLDEVIGGVDVFWSPHFNFTCLSKNTKKIITVHDLSFLRYPEFFNARKNFLHQALGIKKTLCEADKIIAVSENTKNDIVELLGISEEKVKVIYSGNNTVKTEVNKNIAEKYLASHKINGRFILYLGTIEPRKNIIGLIDAYNKLRAKNEQFSDLKLVLAGASGWKNKKTYRAWQLSPYKNDIIFLGYVNKEEQDILYSYAAIFAYASFYEGFGFPPLEAMTYGVPVVCSNVSSLPEVVADAAIMVNPYDSGEIAEAIANVLEDSVLREILIGKGYARAQFFTWEKTAQEYLKVFKELK
jgi:glycosyltransferase involved in cell wall biosynthesis